MRLCTKYMEDASHTHTFVFADTFIFYTISGKQSHPHTFNVRMRPTSHGHRYSYLATYDGSVV